MSISSLSVVVVFNYLMDPFELREEHRIDYDRRSNNREKNVALWALCETAHSKPQELSEVDVVILGDSRAALLTKDIKGHRLVNYGGHEIYNFCIGGGTLEESYQLFDIERKRGRGMKKLKAVIIVVPFFRFCEPSRQNRVTEGIELRHNKLRYYLNSLVCKQSTLSCYQLCVKKPPVGVIDHNDDDVIRVWLKGYTGYNKETVAKRIEALRDFSNMLTVHGIKLILYSPPGGGGCDSIIERSGLVDQRMAFVKTMNALGEFLDMANDSSINGEQFTYVLGDPIHHDKGEQVLMKLLKRCENKHDTSNVEQ